MSPAPPDHAAAPPKPADERLPLRTKLVFSLGDHTLNLTLSALSLFYLFFLTEVAGLRPVLASLVLLVGRFVDAVTDPLMGRLSDLTRWRWGRRRPYFLLGAIPFGISFALLWRDLPLDSEAAKFVYYASCYICYSLASTVLAVPYAALLPELTLDYQERTALSTFRSAASVLGTLLAAVGTKRAAEALGADGAGWERMGLWCVPLLALPWLAVYVATWERPGFQRGSQLGLVEGLRLLLRHRTYRQLTSFYLCSRVAIDLIGATFLYYFTYWIGRERDFEPTLGLMLLAVVVSLPFWLAISRRMDKAPLFVVGALWWIGAQFLLLLAGPDWSFGWILAVGVLAGIGYAVAEAIPWSMLGDVIDEDELVTGERREGIYAGSFTFLRKLAGASAVALAGLALDLAGYLPGQPQGSAALATIRGLTALGPALFLALAAWIALGYPLTRAAHADILRRIARRASQAQ